MGKRNSTESMNRNLAFHPNGSDAAWIFFFKLKPAVIKSPVFVIFEEIGSLVPTPGHGGVHTMRETWNNKLKGKQISDFYDMTHYIYLQKCTVLDMAL